jgi:hypothetical protein
VGAQLLGCPTLDSRTSILSLRAQGAKLPHGPFLLSFPMGLVCAVVSQDEPNAGQPPHHQTSITILLLPLVLLAALAADRMRSNVTEGVWAGRVNTLVIWRRSTGWHGLG